jgi:hypothetical protein
MHNFDFWGVAALCVEVVSAYIAVTFFFVDEAEEGFCLGYTYCIYLKYTVQLHAVHLLNSPINLEAEHYVPPKCRQISTRLHGATSQKMVLLNRNILGELL